MLRTIAMLRERPHVRARVAERYRHVLVDELADLGFAPALLVELLAAEHGSLTAAADDDQAARRLRGAASKNVRDFERAHPDAEVVRLERSLRCPQRVLDAARAVVEPIAERLGDAGRAASPAARVRFWRAADERAQAQAVAAEVERLVRGGCEPERIGVLVRSLRDEGRDVAVAFEERAIGFRTVGEADFFARAEVRDVLAWLRLLADPNDAGAVVRALGRPPVGLRSVDLARCVQIARRRKLDMVSALVAATESPQLAPEARERIHAFLGCTASRRRRSTPIGPDLFLHRLIERLGLRRQQVFSAQADVVERLVHLARLGELASSYARRAPHATPRDFARYVAAVAETELRDEDAAPPRAGRRAGHGARRRRGARARARLRPRAGVARGCRARACARPSRSPTRCCARSSAPTTARRTSRRCAGCCTRR